MISMDKQYRTRDGREVRIYAVDGGGPYPVHGSIKALAGGEQTIAQWASDGTYDEMEESGCDLIEVKPRIKREVWVNVYKPSEFYGSLGSVYETQLQADNSSASHRIACVKVTIDCEEGEGL